MKFFKRKSLIWILSVFLILAVAFSTPGFTQIRAFASEGSNAVLESLEERFGSPVLTSKVDFMNCKLTWKCSGDTDDEGEEIEVKEFRIYRSSDIEPEEILVLTVDGNTRSAVVTMGGPGGPAPLGEGQENTPPAMAGYYIFTVVPVFAECDEYEARGSAASVEVEQGTVVRDETDYFNGSSEDYSVSREEGHSVFVFSDRHEESEMLITLLKNADEYIKDKFGTGIESVIDDGDNVNDANEYELSKVTGEIKGVLGEDVSCTYIYGSHDENVLTDEENYFLKGPAEYDYFYVYGIDYDEMADYTRGADAAGAFSEWAANIASENKGKPVIIVSHMPMHERRFDNMAALAWLEAINTAGENLDILVLWGHNHTGQNETDGRNYYVAKGDNMLVEGLEEEVQINFTYMNAGYIKLGMASVITIQENKLYISRFGMDGYTGYHVVELEHTFSDAGQDDENQDIETDRDDDTSETDADSASDSADEEVPDEKTDEFPDAGDEGTAGIYVSLILMAMSGLLVINFGRKKIEVH